MARRATLRAADADRERAAERLRRATVEGRLVAEELEQRLGAALTARTYGELDALVSDLPVERAERRRPSAKTWVLAGAAIAVAAVVVIAVVAAMLLILTGVFAAWMVWAVLGWWLLGHRRCGWGRHQRRTSKGQMYGGSRRLYDARRL